MYGDVNNYLWGWAGTGGGGGGERLFHWGVTEWYQWLITSVYPIKKTLFILFQHYILSLSNWNLYTYFNSIEINRATWVLMIFIFVCEGKIKQEKTRILTRTYNSWANSNCNDGSNWPRIHLHRQTSDISRISVGNKLADHANCWSIACRCCSNYIFILVLTPGSDRLGKENCKTRREPFKFLPPSPPGWRGNIVTVQAGGRPGGRASERRPDLCNPYLRSKFCGIV